MHIWTYKFKKGLGGFTKSETIFFESPRKFNKDYYKSIKKKEIHF